jgi:hypothetical protein
MAAWPAAGVGQAGQGSTSRSPTGRLVSSNQWVPRQVGQTRPAPRQVRQAGRVSSGLTPVQPAPRQVQQVTRASCSGGTAARAGQRVKIGDESGGRRVGSGIVCSSSASALLKGSMSGVSS